VVAVKQHFALGLAVLTLPLLAALALGAAMDTPSSSGIVPVHGIHAEAEVDCESCHDTATLELTGLLPTMQTCADCHDIEDESACGTCHQDGPPAKGVVFDWPRHGSLAHFPHETHVEGQKQACSDCHGPDGQGGMTLPQHDTCRQCHATAAGFTDCRMCHADDADLRPRSHDSQYMATHALDATYDEQSCQSCHTQADCQQCHRGDNVRPRVHPLNYVSSHALEARSNERLCVSCHEDASFCSSCHQAEKILPDDHSRADWISSRHGMEASFNIETCIACHDQGENDPICARCHGR